MSIIQIEMRNPVFSNYSAILEYLGHLHSRAVILTACSERGRENAACPNHCDVRWPHALVSPAPPFKPTDMAFIFFCRRHCRPESRAHEQQLCHRIAATDRDRDHLCLSVHSNSTSLSPSLSLRIECRAVIALVHLSTTNFYSLSFLRPPLSPSLPLGRSPGRRPQRHISFKVTLGRRTERRRKRRYGALLSISLLFKKFSAATALRSPPRRWGKSAHFRRLREGRTVHDGIDGWMCVREYALRGQRLFNVGLCINADFPNLGHGAAHHRLALSSLRPRSSPSPRLQTLRDHQSPLNLN